MKKIRITAKFRRRCLLMLASVIGVLSAWILDNHLAPQTMPVDNFLNKPSTTGNRKLDKAVELQRLKRKYYHSRIRALMGTGANLTQTSVHKTTLDFAILGFGKCGTTTLMQWLNCHVGVSCPQREIWELLHGNVDGLLEVLEKLPPYTQRGYKNPLEISQAPVVDLYRQHFPDTKIIIGIRHPVKWFESLYNFRVQNSENGYMPHPNKLIGVCSTGMKHTCTSKGNYAHDLMRLGKQNFDKRTIREANAELVKEILNYHPRQGFNASALRYMNNPVFIYDVQQLGQLDFANSLQDFLQLETPLPPPPRIQPGRVFQNETRQELLNSHKMDICREEYSIVHRELMALSKLNAKWLRHFVRYPNVTAPANFEKILDDYERDPCGHDDGLNLALRVPQVKRKATPG